MPLIQFTLTAAGEIKDVKALRASHPIFARNSMRIVGEYKCQGQGRDVDGHGAVRLQARMKARSDPDGAPASSRVLARPLTERTSMRHLTFSIHRRVRHRCAGPLPVRPDAFACGSRRPLPLPTPRPLRRHRPSARPPRPPCLRRHRHRWPLRRSRRRRSTTPTASGALGAGRLRRARHADHPGAHEHGQLVHPLHQALREPEAQHARPRPRSNDLLQVAEPRASARRDAEGGQRLPLHRRHRHRGERAPRRRADREHRPQHLGRR